MRPHITCDFIRSLPAGGASVSENSTKKTKQNKTKGCVLNSPVRLIFLSPHCVMGSERISGLADYSHMTVSRNCGGSHTVNSASQRRQSTKHYTHAEVDLMVQVCRMSFIFFSDSKVPAKMQEIELFFCY